MDFWLLIEHIGWILIVIVGTFYAIRELQDFWYNFAEHRIKKATLKTEASVEAIVAKITGTGKAAVDGVTGAGKAAVDGVADAVDGARSKLADGMEAAADEVRPDVALASH